MLALVEISPRHWVGFILLIIIFLALDLGVFHRRPHVVPVKEALAWTLFWMALALGFAAMLVPLRGRTEALQFCTGYFLELSLSVDNVFVIVLIFAYFRVLSELQHRVLVWGVLGAIFMRGLMIGLGAALINRFLNGAVCLRRIAGFHRVKDAAQPRRRRPVKKAWSPVLCAGFFRFRLISTARNLHPLQWLPDDHAVAAGLDRRGNHRRSDSCRGFHPGHFRRDPEAVHRLHP